MDVPGDTSSLGVARSWLRERVDNGANCPCCGQRAQVYWRSINSGMAASAVRLLWRHRLAPGEFVHLPSVIGRRSAEEAKLRYWGLIEEEPKTRPDGGRTGFWRLTQAGISWASGYSKLPRYVRVFDSHALEPPTPYSKAGNRMPEISIYDALGNDFNYDELMRGEG